MNANNYVIRTENLSYSFGAQQVVKSLDLAVPKASVYGFLGPNGAGKSTTIKLLLGLLQSPNQKIFLFGKPLRGHRLEILARVGNLIESPSLYQHLTAWENLRFLDKIFGKGRERIAEILEMVGLTAHRNKKVKHFSLGMKQRLGIGMALFHDPELLFLDEPFNGLDPSGVVEMRSLIERISAEGKTVFVSSHILAEIEKICSHVAILNEGEMMYQGKMEDLLSHSSKMISLRTPDRARLLSLCESTPYEVESTSEGTLRFKLSGNEAFNALVYFLTDHKIGIHNIESWSPGLEDIFFNLTQTKAKA